MNRKITLILLGTACLIALGNLASAVDPTTASATAAEKVDDSSEEGGRGQNGGRKRGDRGLNFRKEVEKIFDEFKVDTTVRDQILDRIKQRMEQLHSEKSKGGFRRGSKDEKKEEKKPMKVRKPTPVAGAAKV